MKKSLDNPKFDAEKIKYFPHRNIMICPQWFDCEGGMRINRKHSFDAAIAVAVGPESAIVLCFIKDFYFWKEFFGSDLQCDLERICAYCNYFNEKEIRTYLRILKEDDRIAIDASTGIIYLI